MNDEVVMLNVAQQVLDEAAILVQGPRRVDYGDPSVNLERIAQLWLPILGQSVEPFQVALCLAQLKVARILTNPLKVDSWIDMAGYAAIGAEVAIMDTPEETNRA